jgi:putative ABC transport system permease protein
MARAPSDVARALLTRLGGMRDQDALGDLDEEFAERRRRRGRVQSEVWYLVEALSLGTAMLATRLRFGLARMRRGGVMRGFANDVRHALRGLVREPGTAVVMVLTLSVAVGATTSVMAVADAAFLRPLPYPDASRLVRIFSGAREDPDARFSLSPLDLRDLEAYSGVIEDIGAWTAAETVHMTDLEEPLRLEAPRASSSLFRILGVQPILGRFFTPQEEVPGADNAVVLSHALWRSAFGADSAVVGEDIRLDGAPYRVVGVAPPEVMLPRDADAWRALALGPEWYDPGRWGWQFLQAVARLAPGVDPERASAMLTERLAESVPDRVERGQTRVVRTLHQERLGESGPALLLLLGAVGLLLFMACANVMNVMLARSERRIHEFGLRRALGSGAGPLIRLVILETSGFAALGGLGGAAVGFLAMRLFRSADFDTLAYVGDVGMNSRVAGFTLAVVVATASAFGAATVLRALLTDPQAVLRESSVRVGASRATKRMRDGLAVAEVALASLLLVAVGASASAFLGLVDRDPGFRANGVLAAVIELPANAYAGEEGVVFYRSLLDRMRALPGVTGAGATQFLPLEGIGWSASIELIDPDPSVTDPDPGGNMRPVSPGYFETLAIPVLEGRPFTESDDMGAPPVVVVDETLARRYWPNGSPVGLPLYVGALSSEDAIVVGVVGNVPDESLSRPGNGHVYFPLLQRPMRRMTLVVRVDGDPTRLAPAVRGTIRDADPRIPVIEVSTLESRVRRSVAAPRAGLLLLSAFGIAAAVLAAVGIYGVLAYTVARRTGEIGTRIALGAAPRAVLGSVVAQAMRLWLLGTVLGGLGAVAVVGLLARFIQGVEAADPTPYVVAILSLGLVALLAAMSPAARAVSVDPTRALRAE